MPGSIVTDCTWFSIVDGKLNIPRDSEPYSFRSASLLKPLYMWAACEIHPFNQDTRFWYSLAKPAVINSDNKTTTEVWNICGYKKILSVLNQKTRQPWQFMEGYSTWGSIEVDSAKISKAYTKLVTSHDKNAQLILGWMKNINIQQTFGIKQMLQDYLELKSESIAMKTGWDIDEKESRLRTHAVAICELTSNEYLGFVLLMSKKISTELRHKYLKADPDGDEVLQFHIELSSTELQAELFNLLKKAKSAH